MGTLIGTCWWHWDGDNDWDMMVALGWGQPWGHGGGIGMGTAMGVALEWEQPWGHGGSIRMGTVMVALGWGH